MRAKNAMSDLIRGQGRLPLRPMPSFVVGLAPVSVPVGWGCGGGGGGAPRTGMGVVATMRVRGVDRGRAGGGGILDCALFFFGRSFQR